MAIVYKDGVITLWSIRESKAIFMTGGSPLQSMGHETKKATTACWCCPYGSKLVVGYSNGEIFIWSIPATSNSNIDQELEEVPCGTQSAPICKLNLGYKLDKIPIAKLIWVYAEGKASRLYAMGSPDCQAANLLQVTFLFFGYLYVCLFCSVTLLFSINSEFRLQSSYIEVASI